MLLYITSLALKFLLHLKIYQRKKMRKYVYSLSYLPAFSASRLSEGFTNRPPTCIALYQTALLT